MKYLINDQLPGSIMPPLRFREPDKQFEGEVNHPIELVRQFEPQDVLNGAIELVDAAGVILTVHTDDKSVVASNEYPDKLVGIYFQVEDRLWDEHKS